AATILVLALGGGITGMVAVQLGVAVAILGAVSILARRRLDAAAPVAADPGPLRRSVLRYAGSALAGSLITLIVFRRSEFFFLEHYTGDREVALYSISFAAVTTLVLVPQALAGARCRARPGRSRWGRRRSGSSSAAASRGRRCRSSCCSCRSRSSH